MQTDDEIVILNIAQTATIKYNNIKNTPPSLGTNMHNIETTLYYYNREKMDYCFSKKTGHRSEDDILP